VIASIAEVNRTPFDLPEAESEIIAGYHTEYSGMRFGLFFLAEYLSVFAVSCVATALFLGGGAPLPFVEFPLTILSDAPFSVIAVDVILIPIFLAKVLCFIFLMFWIRATLPRMRVDRLMNFAWKYLVPLSIANVFFAGIWFELVIRPGTLTLRNWFFGTVVTGPLVVFALWVVLRVNRRAKASAPLGAEWPTVGAIRPQWTRLGSFER
jgi:NADH-quinone oxidoreductase subunit H